MKLKLPVRKGAGPKKPAKLKLKASVARSRRAPIIEEDDEYFDEPEPNMKLSHAFVVVLVLHVIAVGGVFAFNTIKTKQDDIFAATREASAPVTETVETAATTTTPVAPAAGNALGAPAAQASAQPQTHVIMAGETLTRVASKYGVSVAALQAANNIEDPTKIRIGTTLTIPDGSTPVAPAAPAPAAVKQEPAAPVAKAPEPAPAPVETEAPAASETVYEVVKGDNPVTIAKKFNVSEAALMEINGIDDPRKLQIGQKLKLPAN